jgi:glycosyltransferase involved in cell wall biosynthesis
LPKNIKIISLSSNKFFKIFTLQFKLLKVLFKVDGVFCHQNPEYTILSAPLAKLFRKKIISWYTHKAVNWRRRLLERLTDKIITVSDKSFRNPLFPKKVEIVGHGIDINYFINNQSIEKTRDKFKIISIGRISPAKDYEILIKAIEILTKKRNIKNLEVQIIGGPGLKEQEKYFERLKQLIKEKNLEKCIEFLGPIPHNQILSYYQDCDLFVNMSQTGSVDKAVLEAMACEKLVLTSNEAFKDILNDERLMFESKDSNDLANKIINLMNLSEKEKQKISQNLRKEVVENHNLDKLVKKILKAYEK